MTGPHQRSSMFVFISHLSVPEGDRGELERYFHERSRLVDSFPGFLDLQLLRPESGDEGGGESATGGKYVDSTCRRRKVALH